MLMTGAPIFTAAGKREYSQYCMKTPKIIEQIDRWGTILLIYLIPWQARLIFSQGYLAASQANRRRGRFSPLKLLIAALLIVRFAAMAAEKDKIVRAAVTRLPQAAAF